MALQSKSTHPIATALVKSRLGCIGEEMLATDASVDTTLSIQDFQAIPGCGVRGTVVDADGVSMAHIVLGNKQVGLVSCKRRARRFSRLDNCRVKMFSFSMSVPSDFKWYQSHRPNLKRPSHTREFRHHSHACTSQTIPICQL